MDFPNRIACEVEHMEIDSVRKSKEQVAGFLVQPQIN